MQQVIVVVLCDVLNYTKECFVLKEINILNSIMSKDPKYNDLLMEYDKIGIVLADNIKSSFSIDHNKDLWINFYKMFLSEIAVLVASNQYDQAIIKYQNMILVLNNYFNTSSYSISKTLIKKDSCFC